MNGMIVDGFDLISSAEEFSAFCCDERGRGSEHTAATDDETKS